MSPTHYHRLFLALWPDGAVRVAVRDAVARLQRLYAPGGRAVNPARYHVTLQFFGDFAERPEAMIADVRRALGNLDAPRFVLPLERTGRFGGAGWLGPERTPDALASLWATLDATLRTAGVTTRGHDHFVPHLTVLRDIRRPLPAVAIKPISWPVDRVVLIDSHHGEGPVYEHVASWPLR